MLKYIPDVSRSLIGILDQMHKRKLDEEAGVGQIASPRKHNVADVSPAKRFKSNDEHRSFITERILNGEITEESIKEHMTEAVEANIYSGLDENDVNGAKCGGRSTKNKSLRDNDDRLLTVVSGSYR